MFESASNMSGRVDDVFLYITALTASFLVFITAVMVFFVIRYRRERSPRGEDIHGHLWLELAWTGIPLILFLSMFYYGWTNWSYMRSPPRDAMVVKVIGRQWAWAFVYPNGKQTNELYLAVDRPVKVELESADVVHGFYIPAFRVKEDVVPGKKNFTWFTPTLLGSYDIQCTVICGVNHTYMLSKANVIPERVFKDWYFSDSEEAPQLVQRELGPGDAARGAEVARQVGCLSCHTVDGSKLVAPSWKGIYGTRQALASGSARDVLVDDAYLARSIVEPHADLADGYATMPPVRVDEQQTRDLVAYIQTLR